MTDQLDVQDVDTQTPADIAATPDNTLTNADVKGHSLFKKVTTELAEMKAAEAARVDAEAQAKADADKKKAIDEGRFEDAIKMRDEELESLKSTHSKQLLQRDLTNELVKAGFANQMFLDGAVGRYDVDTHTSVEAYVSALVTAEENKSFLTTGDGRTRIQAASASPVGGNNASYTVDQIKQMQKSDDPKIRANSRKYLKDYLAKNGKMPDGL